ncbi:MAG: ion channel [Desulfofustis sp.]
MALFFALLIIAFAKQFIKAQEVSLQLIFGTLCLYLIIGLLWGSLYSLLYTIDPESFSGVLLDNSDSGGLLTTFNYFSIVTLTTLGYGDITPQTPAASSLCQIEAITGQFFTAVLVAWLVGTHVSSRVNNVS